MIGKLLTVIAVAVMVWLMLKRRGERIEAVNEATPASGSSMRSDMRLVAYLFIGVMVVMSAGMFYLQWRDQLQEVTVEVINSATGDRNSYRVRLGDIDGRQFTTLDGRTISIAESERLEVLSPE